MIKMVLDPGHKRDRRGGVIFAEGENNYRYSLILKEELEKYNGIKVYNTRSNMDDDPSLYSRATMYGKVDLFWSIHSNAAGASVRGTEIINSFTSVDDKLAQRHVKLISETLNTPNRGVKYSYYNNNTGNQVWTGRYPTRTDYLGVLRDNPSPRKYLIEYVFHTNYEDSKVFVDKARELARKEAKMVADYYGLKPKKNVNLGGLKVSLGKFKPKEVKGQKIYNLYSLPNKTSKVVGTFATREFKVVDVLLGQKYVWGVTEDTGHRRYFVMADVRQTYGTLKK